MIVLVPSYEPDERLIDLVAGLRAAAPDTTVLVVDDGSGPEYDLVFDVARARGAEVIGFPGNQGKGAALKAGFRHIIAQHPGELVVCADSDGQHRVADVLRVAARAAELSRAPAERLVPAGGADVTHPPRPEAPPEAAGSTMVLGGRRFAGAVPLRSRVGNTVSRGLFKAATGLPVGDTQTGLRAYPPELLPWLVRVKGDRFEYELNALLEARASGVLIEEVPIDTVYLEQNASSHFRPVIDSLRVMRPMLRYVLSSLAAFVIDVVALQVLFATMGSLLVSVVGARLLSASVNFVVNRQLVFRSRQRRPVRRDAVRYAALAVVLLAANYGALTLLTAVGMPLLAAKLVTEITLYAAGFAVQRRFVFRRRPR